MHPSKFFLSLITPKQSEITHFPQTAFFENLFPQPERGEAGEENMRKLKK